MNSNIFKALKINIVIFKLILIITLLNNLSLHAQYENLKIFNDITPNFTTSKPTIKRLKNKLLSAKKKKDTTTIIKCLVSLGSIYRYNLEFEKAFDFLGEAVYMSEEFKDAYLKAKAHEEFGIIYLNFFQDEAGKEHFKKSLHNYQLAHKLKNIDESELFYPYFNLFRQNWRMGEKEVGRIYLDSCKLILKKTNLNRINMVYLNFAEAEYLYNDGSYIKAKELLTDARIRLENLPKNKKAVSHKNFLSVIYNGLARIESTLGNKQIAISYLEKALSKNIISNEFIFFQEFARSNFATLLAESGDYKGAYKQIVLAKHILDDYLNPRRAKSQGFLSVINPYKSQLQKKDIELSNQRLELSEKKQEVFRIQSILFILIGFIIIVTIIFWAISIQLKQKKQIQMSKELLEHKNKELTANMLQLIEKEDIIKSLSDIIKQPNKENISFSYLKNLKKNSTSLWEEFNSRFVELNTDFYDHLHKKVPNLTPLEIKICALLKLNFSGKEMARLLGMSLNSVNVARSRFRKKLNLDRETNLTGFINSI